jgi:hypothetical protein
MQSNMNTQSARSLLQRALRANASSRKLWARYFELELWNSLRIVQRQKHLSVLPSQPPTNSAPLVVFRHAIRAIPALEFAIEILLTVDGANGFLAQQIVSEMKIKFSNEPALWTFLVEHLSLPSSSAPKKRKRGEETSRLGSFKLAVASAQSSFSVCLGLLREVGEVTEQLLPDNRIEFLEPIARSVAQVLASVGSSLSSCLSEEMAPDLSSVEMVDLLSQLRSTKCALMTQLCLGRAGATEAKLVHLNCSVAAVAEAVQESLMLDAAMGWISLEVEVVAAVTAESGSAGGGRALLGRNSWPSFVSLQPQSLASHLHGLAEWIREWSAELSVAESVSVRVAAAWASLVSRSVRSTLVLHGRLAEGRDLGIRLCSAALVCAPTILASDCSAVDSAVFSCLQALAVLDCPDEEPLWLVNIKNILSSSWLKPKVRGLWIMRYTGLVLSRGNVCT